MAIQCEICGSTNLLKENGVFVCQSCGLRYSVEEIRRMMGTPPSAPTPSPAPAPQPNAAAEEKNALEERIRQTEAICQELLSKKAQTEEKSLKLEAEMNRLNERIDQLSAKKKGLDARIATICQRAEENGRLLTSFNEREQEIQRQAAELRARGDVIVARHGVLMQEKSRLGPYDTRRLSEIDREVGNILREVDSLNARLNALASEQLQTQPRWQAALQESQRIQTEAQQIQTESQQIVAEHEKILAENARLRADADRLIAEAKKLDEDYAKEKTYLKSLYVARDFIKKK